jgi:hypothetical protein
MPLLALALTASRVRAEARETFVQVVGRLAGSAALAVALAMTIRGRATRLRGAVQSSSKNSSGSILSG